MMKYNFLEARSEKGCENDIFWSEIGSGFGEPGGTPTPIIPRNPYPPPPPSRSEIYARKSFFLQALGSAAETVGVLSITSPANKKLLIASLVIFVIFLTSGVSWEYVYRRDHFNLFKTASSELTFFNPD